jgi:Fe-S cluster assembly protein SufB
MLDLRLKALKIFHNKNYPKWGPKLDQINLENLHYYVLPRGKKESDWNKLPEEIAETFERLGIPEAEKKFLAATSAQYESEVVYKSVQEALEKQGVIFESTDNALKKYPHFFKEYFGKIVPANDNKFAALNSAVWSGGSFIYVPKGVKLPLPLQAYFRMNADNMGQFERTLIIADEGSSVHYIEGCTAPVSAINSLHAAVVEIIAKKGARVQYTTLQDWSHNIYNLVTKRAHAHENAEVLWLDCNIGAKVTMKYPAVYLLGDNSRGEIHSLAVGTRNQHQDTGAKVIHSGKNTRSIIVSKSISKDGGRTSYRGLMKINKGAKNAQSKVSCDALILDKFSRSDTYPTNIISERDSSSSHEATVSKINEDQLFYMMSRGLTEEESGSMIINGFADPIIKKLPMEYALELNRLLEIEMTDSVG